MLSLFVVDKMRNNNLNCKKELYKIFRKNFQE